METTKVVPADKNNCSTPERKRCCVNHYFNTESNSCILCPLGTFGNQCRSVCPPSHYGRLCKLKCNCDIGISCLPKTGCVSLNDMTYDAVTLNTLLPAIVVLAVISLLCLAFGVSCYLRSWKFDRKNISKILRFRGPENKRRRQNAPSISVTNVNYSLAQRLSDHTIQGMQYNKNDPMDTTVRIYEDVSPAGSDYVGLKRQTSDYRTLELRIRNISFNSLDFDTMENNDEDSNLSSCCDKKIPEASRDVSVIYNDSSGSVCEGSVSDHCERDPVYEVATLEVHAEP